MSDPSKKSGMGEPGKGAVTSGAMDLGSTGMDGRTPHDKTQKLDATLQMMTMGKASLMARMAQSPPPANTGKTQDLGGSLKKNMKQTEATNLGSTMAGTMGGTLEATKSSPFRETINRGFVTGIGLLNKPKFNH